ncbi:Vitamin B6 biosynthesis [Fusarium albosuccineum]|uniref:Vitamin B6 biosynthesis n=1 Tax=Fusarium albosuccineum TaxID=1237068 RepID=A0A8H4LIR6_9HYPO|nr:Vitamin B6 biosynthesis [Fusarium albosuccineum]
MPLSETFLELQSNAPGLPGPYLVENLAPYQILDGLGTMKPKTILAIGSRYKREFLASSYFIENRQRDRSVGLARGSDGTLVFDCELHLQNDSDKGMPRFQKKRPWGGGLNEYVLQQAHSHASRIAYNLYGEVLAPFSDVILVFVPDLGLEQVIELCYRWFKSSIESNFPKSQRILFLHHSVPQAEDVHFRFLASFASMLRRSEAIKAYTIKDIQQILSETFCITNVGVWSPTLIAEIDRQLADAVLQRSDCCLDFEAPLFKYLLQAAIRHHAEQPHSPFDVILALRPQPLQPDGLRDALSDFVRSRPHISSLDIAVVASAFVMGAYSAGIHWFRPELVFERFYRDATEHCGKQLKYVNFSHAIQLCQSPNHSTFIVKPPTAGTRMLDLGGTNVKNIRQFLHDLQREIGLHSLALTEHFDSVVGSDAGMFFIVTAFLDGWGLADCAYHIGRLRGARLKRNNLVSFGKGLTWDLGNPRLYNNKEVFLAFGKKVLRRSGQITDEEEIYVRYSGGPYNHAVLTSISASLVAALFYIELVAAPTFYAGPELCMIRLQCRVPPGDELLELLYSLYRRKTRLCYASNGLDHVNTELCTEDLIHQCENRQPFMKELLVEVMSADDNITIQLESAGGKYPVSGCPYKVQDLIKDQGLDLPLGRQEREHSTVPRSVTGVEEETQKLLELLRTMGQRTDRLSSNISTSTATMVEESITTISPAENIPTPDGRTFPSKQSVSEVCNPCEIDGRELQTNSWPGRILSLVPRGSRSIAKIISRPG